MKQRLQRLNQLLYRLVASHRFYLLIIGLFALTCIFVAAVSVYPMAFDEDFHLGIIKIYAAHPLPWGFNETSAMAQYGNVPHDPSWLFHWLMSFPYNFFHAFGFNEAGIVFCLRVINVALFVGGVILTQKVLVKTRLGNASINVIIALWLLIPIMSQVAAQINYDNLIIFIFALALWLAQKVLSHIRAYKPFLVSGLWLLITLLIGSATKYAFLPAAVGIAIVIIVAMWQNRQSLHYGKLPRKRLYAVALLVLLIVSLGANYRYVENVVTFRAINPSCDQTFQVDDCMQYGVYARDTHYRANKADDFAAENPLSYFVTEWIPGLVFRLFFAVAGPTNGYDTRLPVVIPIAVSSIIAILAVIMCLIYFRATLRKPYFWLFFLPTALYMGALFVQLYSSYQDTAIPVAINGRYLLPFIPIGAALVVPALQKIRRLPYASIIVSAVLILLVLTGGGVGTYISQSRMSWFYNGPARSTTNILRDLSSPLVPTFE